ncbi:hypothetical protein SLE2022_086330 [Rubroshorea leprosula]
MGLYFWERKPKTEGSQKNIDKVIKTNAGNSEWNGRERIDIEDHDNTTWGVKRTFKFNHKIDDGKKTGWMMKEYVLDPSRVEVGRDTSIAFCHIYKKWATSNSRAAAVASLLA